MLACCVPQSHCLYLLVLSGKRCITMYEACPKSQGGPMPQTLQRFEIFVHEDSVHAFDLRLIVRLRSFPRINPIIRGKCAYDDNLMVS